MYFPILSNGSVRSCNSAFNNRTFNISMFNSSNCVLDNKREINVVEKGTGFHGRLRKKTVCTQCSHTLPRDSSTHMEFFTANANPFSMSSLSQLESLCCNLRLAAHSDTLLLKASNTNHTRFLVPHLRHHSLRGPVHGIIIGVHGIIIGGLTLGRNIRDPVRVVMIEPRMKLLMQIGPLHASPRRLE